MSTPVSITCPICHERLPVPSEVLQRKGEEVVVRLDASSLREHYVQCSGTPSTGKGVAKSEEPKKLDSQTEKMLKLGSYVRLGKRACLMCGVENTPCMAKLRNTRQPCCPACGDGDTHPVPQGGMSCAEWGRAFGAKS